MLPLRFFRSRAFSATSVVSLAMSFGIFGSIFLLAQFFQTVWGYGPLEAGLRTLPWTGMPMLVAPIAGALSDKIGSRPLMAAGLGLQAVAIVWLAAITSTDVAYIALVPAFVIGGTGMALVFSPVANAILGAVKPHEAGQASGANNAIRELGGVLGVAVLAAVFSASGGYQSGQAFVDGLQPALCVGAAVLAVGAVAALLVPGKPRAEASVGRRGRAGAGPGVGGGAVELRIEGKPRRAITFPRARSRAEGNVLRFREHVVFPDPVRRRRKERNCTPSRTFPQ